MGEGFASALRSRWKQLTAIVIAVIAFAIAASYLDDVSIKGDKKEDGTINQKTYVTGQDAPPASSGTVERIADILQNDQYQLELPEQEKFDPVRSKAAFKGLGTFLIIMAWVLKMSALIGIAAIIWLIVTSFKGRHQPGEQRIRQKPSAPTPQLALVKTSLPDLDDARALAGAGQFGEAVRSLLKVTMNQLVARREISIGPSTTAREIVRQCRQRRDGLVGSRLEGFEVLVSLVEKYAFAKEVLGEEDYIKGQASFDLIT